MIQLNTKKIAVESFRDSEAMITIKAYPNGSIADWFNEAELREIRAAIDAALTEIERHKKGGRRYEKL